MKAGDEFLRLVLIESAHRLIRYNKEWRAMANRWIRKLFHQMVKPITGTKII